MTARIRPVNLDQFAECLPGLASLLTDAVNTGASLGFWMPMSQARWSSSAISAWAIWSMVMAGPCRAQSPCMTRLRVWRWKSVSGSVSAAMAPSRASSTSPSPSSMPPSGPVWVS